MDTVVWPDIGVGADVFAQHAGLLAADTTFLTDVFTSSTPANINILLIRFVSVEFVVQAKRDAYLGRLKQHQQHLNSIDQQLNHTRHQIF